jgi:hypothetical protein
MRIGRCGGKVIHLPACNHIQVRYSGEKGMVARPTVVALCAGGFLRAVTRGEVTDR